MKKTEVLFVIFLLLLVIFIFDSMPVKAVDDCYNTQKKICDTPFLAGHDNCNKQYGGYNDGLFYYTDKAKWDECEKEVSDTWHACLDAIGKKCEEKETTDMPDNSNDESNTAVGTETKKEVGCGDGVCSILEEFCYTCASDCPCYKGSKCVDSVPEGIDTSHSDWRGCISLTPKINELRNEYKKNIDSMSRINEDRIILNKVFRRNLAKAIIKFVAFEAPKPTSALDLLSEVGSSIMYDTFNVKKNMTDPEILNLQKKAIQDLNAKMKKIYQQNKQIKEELGKLQ
jgi:hypothetical protein